VLSTLALALLLLDPSSDRPSLVVQIDRGDEACVDVDLPHLHDAVELTLGWALEHRQAAPALQGDTVVTIACVENGDLAIELGIDDPQTGTIASRMFDAPTSADPERRAEVLAIAVADLVRSTWHALEQEAPAVLEANDPEHTSTRTRRRARNIARRPTAPWLVSDGFVVRSYFGERAPAIMLGEQAELLHRPLRNLAWKIDGELMAWRVPTDVGGVVRTLAVTVAPALLGYGEFGGSSRPGRPGRVAIYGGAGARFGGVRMLGEASTSREFRPLGGPLATARIEVACARFVRLALVGEAGWLLAGPEDPQGLRMLGPWANGVFMIVSAF
jgi:hypothetical protein